MDRWCGILKVPLLPNSKTYYRIAASLCLSTAPRTLVVPSANAIFFSGDRVEGTGNPVIERLSNLEKIAEILVSKFGVSVNAWVIEASTFTGPFAVYRDFVPSVNEWGEPASYNPRGFPASTSTVSLISSCFDEASRAIFGRKGKQSPYPAPSSSLPRTFILGFSKGGTVVNQLIAELAFSEIKTTANPVTVKEVVRGWEENQMVPSTKESLFGSINEIHYLDVGLNSPGAYINDCEAIKRISKYLASGETKIRFLLHGTPRQWRDESRPWIQREKENLVHLLESEARRGGNFVVSERFYFADRHPDMQMHFEIIEAMDVN